MRSGPTTKRSSKMAATAMVGLAFLATACGSDNKSTSSSGSTAQKGTITIGAFNFPESQMLANICGGALRDDG